PTFRRRTRWPAPPPPRTADAVHAPPNRRGRPPGPRPRRPGGRRPGGRRRRAATPPSRRSRSTPPAGSTSTRVRRRLGGVPVRGPGPRWGRGAPAPEPEPTVGDGGRPARRSPRGTGPGRGRGRCGERPAAPAAGWHRAGAGTAGWARRGRAAAGARAAPGRSAPAPVEPAERWRRAVPERSGHADGPRALRKREGEASAVPPREGGGSARSEEHTSELQSRENLVCRLLLEKKKKRCKLPRGRQCYVAATLPSFSGRGGPLQE